jgi:tetratricopeptide (TPR) repeat protein
VPKPPPAPAARAGAALLVAAITAGAFAPSLAYSFLSFDDGATITANPRLESLGGLGELWTSLEGEQYYPLTWTTHAIERRIFRSDPRGYHAVNVALHALNAVLLLRLLRRSVPAASAALAGTLLFALHPSQAMTVAWVAERKNLLSLAFLLGAALLWTRTPRRRRDEFLALAAFVLALLSKSAVLLFPVLLVLWDRTRPTAARASWPRLLPFFAAALAATVPTLLSEARFVADAGSTPIPDRVLCAAMAAGFYALKPLWPLPLAPFHPPFDPAISSFRLWGTLCGFLVAAILLGRARRPLRRTLLAHGAAFFAFLVPVLGLVPYGNLELTPVSEHYLYAPLAVAAHGAALALARPWPGRRWAWLAASALLAAFAVLTWSWLPAFRDSRSFFLAAERSVPGSFVAQFGLGDLAYAEGRFAEAAAHFARARAAKPAEMDAARREAEARLRLGDDGALEAVLLDLARSGLHRGFARFELARVALRKRSFDAAARELEQLPAAESEHPWCLVLRAHAARGLGREEESLRLLDAALEREPGFLLAAAFRAHLLASARSPAVRDPLRARAALASQGWPPGLESLLAETRAWILLGDGRREEALAAFAALRASTEAGAARLDRIRGALATRADPDPELRAP